MSELSWKGKLFMLAVQSMSELVTTDCRQYRWHIVHLYSAPSHLSS